MRGRGFFMGGGLRRSHGVNGAAALLATASVDTYPVCMNVTLSVDEQLLARARKKAAALGKSLNQAIRDYLERLAGGDDPERSIEELRRLSGKGSSGGRRLDRDELHGRP